MFRNTCTNSSSDIFWKCSSNFIEKDTPHFFRIYYKNSTNSLVRITSRLLEICPEIPPLILNFCQGFLQKYLQRSRSLWGFFQEFLQTFFREFFRNFSRNAFQKSTKTSFGITQGILKQFLGKSFQRFMHNLKDSFWNCSSGYFRNTFKDSFIKYWRIFLKKILERFL